MKKIKNAAILTHSKYLKNKEIKKLCDFLRKENIALSVISIDKSNQSDNNNFKKSDLIIVFGGDGLFLTASKIAYKFSIPILGVNVGKIGFLVDLNKKEIIKKIKDILLGEFFVDCIFAFNLFTSSVKSSSSSQ